MPVGRRGSKHPAIFTCDEYRPADKDRAFANRRADGQLPRNISRVLIKTIKEAVDRAGERPRRTWSEHCGDRAGGLDAMTQLDCLRLRKMHDTFVGRPSD